jgi:imidazolonepropionase-like amidohydrolase
VRFLAGTDTPYPPAAGFSLHDELALLVNGGLTKMDALRTATTNVGDFLGREAVGRIRAGCAANLVLLDANPLDDIRNTQRIRAVVLRGELLDRKMLDSMLARVAAAARGN